MGEKLLLILAAGFVIFVAGLLVRLQEKRQKLLEDFSNEILDNLNEAAIEVSILTGNDTEEYSLEELEKELERLNNRLQSLKALKSHSTLRRNHHDKNRKKFANY